MSRCLRVAIILACSVAVAAGQAWVNTSVQGSGRRPLSKCVRLAAKPAITFSPVSSSRLVVADGHDRMPFAGPQEYGVVYFIQTPAGPRLSTEIPVRLNRQIVRQGNAVMEFSERGVVVWGPSGARPAKGRAQLASQHLPR
jgi:hypothetical protein